MFFLGVTFAALAAAGYGISTVLRAVGARRAAVAERERGVDPRISGSGGPSLGSTVDTFRDPAFVLGTAFLVVGFAGGAVAARFLPLFLSQTIVAGNLVITALLATSALNISLHVRDWVAISTVIVSLCLLGSAASPHAPHADYPMDLHWGLFWFTVAFSVLSVVAVYKLGHRGAIVGGAAAGLQFGIIAIGVRILNGFDPFNVVALLTDPAAWTIAIAGSVGFYVQTVALQLGAVNGVTAVLVVGETAGPGIIGVVLLGDSAKPGLAWLAIVGFIGSVIGAMLVAYYGSVDADHFGEEPPPPGGWRRKPKSAKGSQLAESGHKAGNDAPSRADSTDSCDANSCESDQRE